MNFPHCGNHNADIVQRKLDKNSIHNVESRKYAKKTSTVKELKEFERNTDSVHNMKSTLRYFAQCGKYNLNFPHCVNYNVDFPLRGKNG